MKIRKHYGTLDLSMTTCKEIPPTLEAVEAFCHKHTSASSGWYGPPLKNYTVEPYALEGDPRIGWEHVYIIMAEWPDGVRAPVGWTDGPLEET